MQLLHLDITSQFAKLGLSSSKPRMEIRQPHADMQLRQPQPDVTMTKTKGKLEIDQSAAFADANLKSPLTRNKEWAQKAKQKVLQDLAHEVSEGKRLMKIETGNKNVIAQIAKEQSTPKQHQFNIGFVPENAFKVKFRYSPSEIDVKINQNEPIIKFKANEPIIKFQRWDLQIYLKQKPSIEFKITGSNYDLKV